MEVLLYCFTFVTVLASILTLKDLYYSIVSKKWPLCQAKVIESCFEEKSNIDTRVMRYLPNIKYQYVIGDAQYDNDNYNFSKKWLTKNELSQLLTKYAVGKEIEIRVNPKKPEVSVIRAGDTFWHYFTVVVCVGFLFAFIKVLRT